VSRWEFRFKIFAGKAKTSYRLSSSRIRMLYVPGASKEVDLVSKLSRKTSELFHEALRDWRGVKNEDFLDLRIDITKFRVREYV